MHLPALIPLYMVNNNLSVHPSNKGFSTPLLVHKKPSENSPRSAKISGLLSPLVDQKSPISAPLRENSVQTFSSKLQQTVDYSATLLQDRYLQKKSRFSKRAELLSSNAENIMAESPSEVNSCMNPKSQLRKPKTLMVNNRLYQLYRKDKLELSTPDQISTPNSVVLDDECMRNKTDRKLPKDCSLPRISFRESYKQEMENKLTVEIPLKEKKKSILKKENRRYLELSGQVVSKSMPLLDSAGVYCSKQVKFILN